MVGGLTCGGGPGEGESFYKLDSGKKNCLKLLWERGRRKKKELAGVVVLRKLEWIRRLSKFNC